MRPWVHIEAYAIVSQDGMLADADGTIPPSLRIGADQRFFQNGLDGVDLVVHGRNSQEQLSDSATRRRIILTARIPSVARDPASSLAILWNPAGASFDQALAAIGSPNESAAVIGGPSVFEMFLDLYDVFYLSRADKVRIPGGRPIFRDAPARTPEAMLAAHGLENPRNEVLDNADGLTITAWRRPEL